MREIIKWTCNFQLQVNEVVGGPLFQSTAGVWNPIETDKLPTIDEEILEEEWKVWKKKVKV
eukprot:12170127-Ditylum_brightwellii.AAC.1